VQQSESRRRLLHRSEELIARIIIAVIAKSMHEYWAVADRGTKHLPDDWRRYNVVGCHSIDGYRFESIKAITALREQPCIANVFAVVKFRFFSRDQLIAAADTFYSEIGTARHGKLYSHRRANNISSGLCISETIPPNNYGFSYCGTRTKHVQTKMMPCDMIMPTPILWD
jgi:hypothetical protein